MDVLLLYSTLTLNKSSSLETSPVTGASQAQEASPAPEADTKAEIMMAVLTETHLNKEVEPNQGDKPQDPNPNPDKKPLIS